MIKRPEMTVGAVMDFKHGSLREKIAAEKMERLARYEQFADAFNEANRLGFAAGDAMTPRAMMVTEHSNPLDDNSVPKRMWHVAEGMCGFAWVTVRPGSCSFAKWLVKNGHARKAYHGGVEIWISAHGQSLERKDAHATAMAKHLSEKLGIHCSPGSRAD